jgi:hypothetical protein
MPPIAEQHRGHRGLALLEQQQVHGHLAERDHADDGGMKAIQA